MAAFAVSDAASIHLALAFSLARFRCVALLAIVLPISMHSPALWKRGRPVLQLARGIATITPTVFFVSALRSMPRQKPQPWCSPLHCLSLCWRGVVPKKRPGFRRAAPVRIGFAGALIVTRPTNLRLKGPSLSRRFFDGLGTTGCIDAQAARDRSRTNDAPSFRCD